jgi:hypothetical protein
MIDCKQCLARDDALTDNDQGASEVYEVGTRAKPQMGHVMYFASDGRTALCAAQKRAEEER